MSLLSELRRRGIRPSRLRGQSFLVDEGVLADIADAAEVGPGDWVVEIGAGPGNLTRVLAERAGLVRAVEVDRGLLEYARRALADLSNVELVEADARRIRLADFAPGGAHGGVAAGAEGLLTVVGNLPYSVTTPVIMRVLSQWEYVRRCVFTVQHEVALRMTAEPGSKAYGALSVAVQYRTRAVVVRLIEPDAFRPRPKVLSAVIRLDVLAVPDPQARDEKALRAVVAGAFSQRRKKLVNSLSGGLGISRDDAAALLEEVGIDPSRRAETVSVTEFVRLADAWAARRDASGEGS